MYNLLFRCVTRNGINKWCEERKQSEHNLMVILNCAHRDGSLQDYSFNGKCCFLLADRVEVALGVCYLLFYCKSRFIPQENKTTHN